jgi:hypothetical protein
MRNLKNLMFYISVLLIFIVPVFTSACIFSILSDSEEKSVVEIDQTEEDTSNRLSGEELEQILENDNFLETFNTFYYPDAIIKEANLVRDEQEMIYVILNTDESFDAVEDYYKNKKVQSIWSRDFIYQKNMAEIEEDFIEAEDKDVKISKFTFSSSNRDKVVDVLVKNLAADRTQIMITLWDLQ